MDELYNGEVTLVLPDGTEVPGEATLAATNQSPPRAWSGNVSWTHPDIEESDFLDLNLFTMRLPDGTEIQVRAEPARAAFRDASLRMVGVRGTGPPPF